MYQAPYEADSQLAYLFKINKIQAVITEDSDLLAYGVRRIWRRKMTKDLNMDGNKISKTDNWELLKFDQDKFIAFWIFCGWDYLDNISSIGGSKSLKAMTEFDYKIYDIIDSFKAKFKVPEAKWIVPEDYYKSKQCI